MDEGFASLKTELRGDSWWVVALTGDGQESINGPFDTEDLADEEFMIILPHFMDACKRIGLNSVHEA